MRVVKRLLTFINYWRNDELKKLKVSQLTSVDEMSEGTVCSHEVELSDSITDYCKYEVVKHYKLLVTVFSEFFK